MLVREAAQLAGVGASRIRQLCLSGELSCSKEKDIYGQEYLDVNEQSLKVWIALPRKVGWKKGRSRKKEEETLEKAVKEAE